MFLLVGTTQKCYTVKIKTCSSPGMCLFYTRRKYVSKQKCVCRKLCVVTVILHVQHTHTHWEQDFLITILQMYVKYLEPFSVNMYIQTKLCTVLSHSGVARYEYTHEILPDELSVFKGVRIPRDRRISVISRNEVLSP